MPAVTFTVTGRLKDYGDDPIVGQPVTAVGTPHLKVDAAGETIFSNEPETDDSGADGTWSLQLVSMPGLWYLITGGRALNPVRIAAYIPDPGDPTTGTAFAPGTTFDISDFVDETPTPGYQGILVGGVTDHGELDGLADDDHPQYALADGTRGTFATVGQGAKADTAVQPADLTAYATDADVTAEQTARSNADTALDGRVDALEAAPPPDLSGYATTTALSSEATTRSNADSALDTRVDALEAAPPGITDHGALSGLGDDDHTQYALADGSRGSFATTAQGVKADSALQAADVTGKLDTSAAPELIRDTMGTALVAGTNITITPNDGADTITIAAAGSTSYTDENARDAIGAALVAGSNMTVTVNDAGDTITLAASAAGGGGFLGAWSSAVNYPAGSIVVHNGQTYGCPAAVASGGSAPVMPVVVTSVPAGQDNIASAAEITIATDGETAACTAYSNATFTTEASEPAVIAANANVRSSWHKYTPATSGTVSFSTAGSSGDSTLEIFRLTGTVGMAGITYVTGQDDNAGGADAVVSVAVTGGQTYYIQIGSWSGVQNYVLTLTTARATAPVVGTWAPLYITAPDISDSTPTGRSLVTAADAAAGRTTLGLGTAATTASTAYATSAQGTKADSAVQPTLVDAKGDLLVGTANDTLARLAAGTDGWVLTADAASTPGMKWAAAAGGGVGYISIDYGASVPGGTAVGTIVFTKGPATDVTYDFTTGALPAGWSLPVGLSATFDGTGMTFSPAAGQFVQAPCPFDSNVVLRAWIEAQTSYSGVMIGPMLFGEGGYILGTIRYGDGNVYAAPGNLTGGYTSGGSSVAGSPTAPFVLEIARDLSVADFPVKWRGRYNTAPTTLASWSGYTTTNYQPISKAEKIGFGSILSTSSVKLSKVTVSGSGGGRIGWWDGSTIQPLGTLADAPGAGQINAQTGTTYTPVLADLGKTITLNNAGAIALSIPGSVFSAGQRLDFIVTGAGMVTVAGTSGATVNGTPSLVSRAQYSAFSVMALSPTLFVVVGDMA